MSLLILITRAHDLISYLQRAPTFYGGTVRAGDIRAQAQFDELQQSAQAEIYRAMATMEQSSGNIAASNLRAGGQALESAADAGSAATLLTGLGSTAQAGYDLLTAKGPKNDVTAIDPSAAMSAYASSAASFRIPGF